MKSFHSSLQYLPTQTLLKTMDSAPEQSGWAEVGLKASSLLGQDFITTWMPVKSTTRVSSALPGSTSSFKNIIAPVIDFVHNRWVIGGGIALVAVAAGVLSFAAYMDHSSASQIDKVQAENRRLFSEIDKLSRDNELLLEGNHRAAQLNQEVQALVRTMQSDNSNPEALQGELQNQLHVLLELVHRQTTQLQARNEQLLAQTRLMREENLCKICCEYPVAKSFVPCGHGTCVKCSTKLNKMPCPFCRTEVDSIIPRY